MIDLFDVSDAPRVFGETVYLFENEDFHLPPGRYALMSQTPEWHRPLLDILSGVRPPALGRVIHAGRISWPLGRQGFVRGKGTGLDVINLVSAVHDVDPEETADIVTMLVSRPDLIDRPIEHWPQFARIEFTFALGLVPDFDIYVVDGSMPSEPSRFTRLWQALFEERLVGKTLILSSYRQKQLLDYCAKALVYEGHRFSVNDDLEACIERFPLRPSREDSTGSGATFADDGGDLGF